MNKAHPQRYGGNPHDACTAIIGASASTRRRRSLRWTWKRTLLRGRRAARRLGAPVSQRQTDGRQTPPISPPTRVGRMAPWNGYSGHPQYIGTIGGLGSLRAVRRPECGRMARVSSLSKAEATWVGSIW